MTGVLDRTWLASHLPHRGAMSLLDEIVAWDDEHLHARATGHGAERHPLRRAGELPIAAAIEYGAQAVAAHGALVAGDAEPPAAGFLASVRGVTSTPTGWTTSRHPWTSRWIAQAWARAACCIRSAWRRQGGCSPKAV